jgi:hypothetical protein
MTPPEFERTEELAAIDWRDVRRDHGDEPSWYGAPSPDHAAGWGDDAREHVARRSREQAERSVDEAVTEWANDDQSAIEQQFDELAAIWRSETRGAPFLVTRVTHWAYQRIIGMGTEAVPLILRELEREPDHWFWALNAITGEDPAEGVEEFDEAVARWLAWGRTADQLS